jgi:hypothetical protein
MTDRTRPEKIESYGKAYNLLAEALQKFPREMWQVRPAEDMWTIQEIVVHIADSEANSYVRCRRFIAEPGSAVMAYDEGQWAKALDYHSRSPETALELFRWLRQSSYDLIQTLPEEAWANQVYHPEYGLITLDDWLDTYEGHIPGHVAQMREVYAAWQKQQPAG